MASFTRVCSQSSLLSFPTSSFSSDLPTTTTTTITTRCINFRAKSKSKSKSIPLSFSHNNNNKSLGFGRILKVKSATENTSQPIQVDSSGGDGIGGGVSGGGGGGGGGGGDNNNNNEGEEEGDLNSNKKKMALSMSQKLTLGYAALVAGGGVMGYLKSGSQKSLIAGGISASILYYAFTQLPTNPTFASFVGLGVSAALLAVMGSRFKKSGKIFPAGVVSLVSLVMTGGYLHGIMRGVMHA